MDGAQGLAKPISETDVEIIRTKIAACTEMAHSIRGKAFQLNDRVGKEEPEKTKQETNDVGQELKDKLTFLHNLLCDAFNSLSAFV